MKYKRPVSHADRWHLHHRLLNVGFSPRRTAIAFWGWTASMSAVSIALRFVNYGNSDHWHIKGLVLLAAVVVIAIGTSVMIAVRLEIIKTRSVRARNAEIAERRALENEGSHP
jgi:hypothetical protein